MGRRKKGSPDKETVLAKVKPLGLDHLPPQVVEALKACSPAERKFVVAYCAYAPGNRTHAAKLAGLCEPDAPYTTVTTRAHHVYYTPQVQAAIGAWMEAFALTGAQITAALAHLADANLGPFVEVDQASGGLKLRALSADDWEAHKHWVKGVETHPKTNKVTKIVLHDRVLALRELAKILKLYSDAPQLNLTLYLSKLSDEALLKQLEEARSAARAWLPGAFGG